jgi:hypothetical protein
MAISAMLKYKRPGRPTVLNEAVYNSLVKTASTGNYVSTCCDAAGISQNTYGNWLDQAKDVQAYINNNDIDNIYNIDFDTLSDDIKPKLVYWQLFQDIKRAQAGAIKKLHDKVSVAADAGPQYWMAAMTLLERIRPELYGKREALDIAVTEGTALLEKLSQVLQIKAP